MISKKLLSEVLSSNVQDIDYEFMSKSFSESVIRYYANGKDYLINIYELAHKCKEWAYNTTGLAVWSTVLTNGSKSEVFKVASLENDFYADTEQESIFQACEWIMEQTK